jgi:hypothetical protein
MQVTCVMLQHVCSDVGMILGNNWLPIESRFLLVVLQLRYFPRGIIGTSYVDTGQVSVVLLVP